MKTRHIIFAVHCHAAALAKKVNFPRKFQHSTSLPELLKYFLENRNGMLVKYKMNPLKLSGFTYRLIFQALNLFMSRKIRILPVMQVLLFSMKTI